MGDGPGGGSEVRVLRAPGVTTSCDDSRAPEGGSDRRCPAGTPGPRAVGRPRRPDRRAVDRVGRYHRGPPDTGGRAVVASLRGWTILTVVYATGADFTDGRPSAVVLETLQTALDEAH